MHKTLNTVVSLVAATLLVSACGDDGRLTRAEFSREATAAVGGVSASYSRVFESVGRRGDSDTVPARARSAIRAAADSVRSAVGDLDRLAPPEAAAADTERLVSAGRRHAQSLDSLASEPSLTVGRLADAIESGPMNGPLEALARKGFVRMPPRGD